MIRNTLLRACMFPISTKISVGKKVFRPKQSKSSLQPGQEPGSFEEMCLHETEYCYFSGKSLPWTKVPSSCIRLILLCNIDRWLYEVYFQVHIMRIVAQHVFKNILRNASDTNYLTFSSSVSSPSYSWPVAIASSSFSCWISLFNLATICECKIIC